MWSNIYDRQRIWKIAFLVISVALVSTFLFYSNRLMTQVAEQERERMEIWADATKRLSAASDNAAEVDFLLNIIEKNHSIPVLLVDGEYNILFHRNFSLPEPVDSLSPYELNATNEAYLQKKLATLKNSGNQIEIKLDDNTTQMLFYEDSTVLRRLVYFPYIQLAVLIIFIIIVYVTLISMKKAEQNKVWVGLSKETAHQLGTPISSLMAWLQMLESMNVDAEIIADMDKDVKRLSVIAERFSKIGSKPQMVFINLSQTVAGSVDYMRTRISKKVSLTLIDKTMGGNEVMMCRPLFEWVIENLTKNAVDAMQGIGAITITIADDAKKLYIDVADTGKGIPSKNFKTVFNPGYTTKSRGWGLGLTLVKRIIEEYHNGIIFVKESVLGEGTTFRIELPKTTAEN